MLTVSRTCNCRDSNFYAFHNAPQVVALITIEVHARDVIEKLGKANCTSANDFEWVSQLRFYWDREKNDCIVKQVRKDESSVESCYTLNIVCTQISPVVRTVCCYEPI